MGAAFREGRLPEPLPLPAGGADEQAAALAALIAKGDEQSTPALLTALLAAGFAVRKSDGSVLKTSGSQGLTIPDWEVAATAKQYGRGQTIGIGNFERAMRRLFPALKGEAVADMLLEDLRAAARGDVAPRRFLARFIAELGKNSAEPYDLLRPDTPAAQVRLDAVQNALVLLRLAGDLAAARAGQQSRLRERAGVVFRPASFKVEPAGEQQPCTLSEENSVVSDLSALSITTLFGKLAGRYASISKYAHLYEGTGGVVNTVLSLMKFIATYASLDVQISMDGKELTRTKTAAPGERRQLTAVVQIDAGKWSEFATCVRPALNAAGLDFSLPGNGGVSNVKVTWVLLEDEEEGGGGAVIHNANLDGIPETGNYQDTDEVGGVYLKGRSDREQFTDQDGRNSITVVGAPQPQDLSNRKVSKVERRVRVAVFPQLKTTDPQNDAQRVGTAGDLLGPTIALLTGDFLGAGVGAATEGLYRSTWFSSDSYPFTVRDWEVCNGWSGTVTITRRSEDHKSESSSRLELKNSCQGQTSQVSIKTTQTQTTSEIYTATAHVRSKDSFGNVEGDATVRYNQSYIATMSGGDVCDEGKCEGSLVDKTERSEMSTSGGGAGQVTGALRVDEKAWSFDIELQGDWQFDLRTTNTSRAEGGCPGTDLSALNQTDASTSRRRFEGINFQGRFNPQKPDEISGSETVKLVDGSTATVTYHFERCK
jgi:hypothetical protein